MPKAVINLHIDLAMLEAIEKLAQAQGITRSEWIRRACQQQLNAEGPALIALADRPNG